MRDTDSANAFAAPGGHVFVSRGLMRLMRDEAELAGVLAHEVAHVLSRHLLRAFTAQERFKLAADVASRATESNALLGSAPVGVTREVYARSFAQDDEFDAGAMGVVIAARGGYDPYALAHVLKTIEGGRQRRPDGLLPEHSPPPRGSACCAWSSSSRPAIRSGPAEPHALRIHAGAPGAPLTVSGFRPFPPSSATA